MPKRLLIALGYFAAAELVGPCAALAAPKSPDAEMGRIGDICARVLGLPAGTSTDYLACRESLSQSVANRKSVSATAAAEAMPEGRAGSFYKASNSEVHRRYQQACALIGATGNAQAECVASLEAHIRHRPL